MTSAPSFKFNILRYIRNVLRKIYGPVFDSQTNEWRKLYNMNSKCRELNIVKELTKRRLMWGDMPSVSKDF